jgi:hypothetical protein
MLWVDGVRNDLKIAHILKLVINFKHVAVHYGAYRRAGSKKEVSYINIAFKVFTGNAIAILVNKLKIGYGLINGINNLFTIYCFCNSIAIAIYRQFNGISIIIEFARCKLAQVWANTHNNFLISLCFV